MTGTKNYMTAAETFGQRLTAERKRLGFTQTKLGEMLGMGRSMVSTIESGHSSLDTARLLGLQEHGLDLIFLTTGKRPIEIAVSNMDWHIVVSATEQINHSAQRNSVELSSQKFAIILKKIVPIIAAGQQPIDSIDDLVLLAT